MLIAVLGACRAFAHADDGSLEALDIGSRKPRSVLSALALHHGSDVSADVLVDLVWGDRPPGGAHGTLHAYISGLRRVLEPGLEPRARPSVLLTTDHGYRLAVGRDAVDIFRFSDAVREAHRSLAPLATQLTAAPASGWPDRDGVTAAVERLEEALAWWNGEPFAELGDHPDVAAQRAGLEELRLTAEEDRALGLLALGDHATVVATTESATAGHPLRERIWALHAVTLTRCGRQAEALDALRQYRTVLAEDLGLDPSPELRTLEHAILNQDPNLQAPGTMASRPTRDPGPVQARPQKAAAPAPVSGAWSTVGREQEAAALTELLDRAAGGTPAAALLVGDAGIGKSRLVEQLVDTAAGHGYVVAVGRCSQDDGAPPLWPWRGVLEALDGLANAAAVGPDETGFSTWEAVAGAIIARAEESPVLVVLEDLHWADTASLRVLTHLLTVTQPRHRVAVVATRRPWPEPVGALAEVGEAFARRHATRLDLAGLGPEETRRLVAEVTGAPVPARTALSWHERAEGNPFFVVELARLFGVGGADEVPANVRDVLLRRLTELPEETRDALVLAAGIGRTFSVDMLALLLDLPADEVDDLLEPARRAGLVLDTTPGVLRFTHALTRDAVAGSVRPTRLARLHAQIAHTMESDPRASLLLRPEERVAELARHWLAAGPVHVGRAWRAAAQAAEQSRRFVAHSEAADLMQAAIEAQRRDPAGTPQERHALLLARAGDCQRMADWRAVVDCATDAVALARSLEDAERLAEAAAEITRNGLWMPHDWGVVNDDLVEDLRWALAALPAADSAARCQVMLALAVELYYAPDSRAEVDALVDEGLAMARRIRDLRLLWWASRAAWIALWRPSLLPRRESLGRESLRVAEELGDPDLVALSHAVVACSALELGDADAWRTHADAAHRIARRRRLAFVSYVLGFVELTLAGLRGDVEASEARAQELRELGYQIHLPAQEAHEAGIALATGWWAPELLAGFLDPLAAVAESLPHHLVLSTAYAGLARLGRVDEAAERMRRRPVPLDVESWAIVFDASHLAELAAYTGDRDLAARVREVLLPCTGRMADEGFSLSIGPVDGYLALAEAVLGDLGAAAGYAERALEQASAWELPLYVTWLKAHRERLAF